jgi:hypothetical protein
MGVDATDQDAHVTSALLSRYPTGWAGWGAR